MLSDNMREALNTQINAEFAASYLYLSMAAYFEATNWPGFAHWMHLQSKEEYGHAMRIYHYVNERGDRVKLRTIEEPKTEWASPLEAFEDAYRHEQKVTGMIHKLVERALSEGDYATNSFLQWFVDEQVEEENSVRAVVDTLKRLGDSPQALYMLDRELAQRSEEE